MVPLSSCHRRSRPYFVAVGISSLRPVRQTALGCSREGGVGGTAFKFYRLAVWLAVWWRINGDVHSFRVEPATERWDQDTPPKIWCTTAA